MVLIFIILRLIRYNCNFLGFISFKDSTLEIPGNAALRDIIMALKWINKNCQNFGGDAKNITLFGHSSGSVCVQILLQCPLAKGLFHKAILMATLFTYASSPVDINYRVAQHLGYQGENNDADILEFLKTVEAAKLVLILKENILTDFEKFQGIMIPFTSHPEPYESAETIFSQQMGERMKTYCSHDIPIMLGYNSHEAIIHRSSINNAQFFERLSKCPQLLLPMEVKMQCSPEEQIKMSKASIPLHFEDKELSISSIDQAIEVIYFMTI